MGRLSLLLAVAAPLAFGQDADRLAPQRDPAAPPTTGRLSWALPRIYPKMGEFHPITAREKFRIALRDAIAPGTFLLAGASAAIGQAQDLHPSMGGGAAGFGRRLAASYGDYAIGYAMTEGVFASLLRQDPRYYRKASGSRWSRAVHAVEQVFVTYSDSGRRTCNVSRIGGDAAAVAVSNAYYVDDRTPGAAAAKFGVYLGLDAASNVFKEFWPDVWRGLQRRK